MSLKGLYFEEMEIGAQFQHELTRTVTEMDNVLFTSLTMHVAPLHLDAEYTKSLPYGQRLVNSLFTVGLIGGMTVPGLVFGTSLGNLGYTLIEFPHPVFHGDTLRAESTILDKRESKSDPTRGIVWFEHRGFNQRDELVCRCQRTGMIMRLPVEAGAEAGHGP
jgi:acyl dehydratase